MITHFHREGIVGITADMRLLSGDRIMLPQEIIAFVDQAEFFFAASGRDRDRTIFGQTNRNGDAPVVLNFLRNFDHIRRSADIFNDSVFLFECTAFSEPRSR